MECDFTRIENKFRDYIISTLGPNADHDYSREIKFKVIKKIIQNGFSAEPGIIPHVFSFGSFPLRTYLPDSDMDITVILEDKSTNQIVSNLSYEYLNKILFMIKSSLEKYNNEIGYQQIYDINMILADVKLIKCKFDSLSFDISINNFVGLCKLIFIHYLETKSFNQILFKRSLFLIKAWCYYEGSVLGSNMGLVASYALEILIIYLFNNYSHNFSNELGALFTFFKMMDETDWDKSIITIFGCLNIDTFYEKLKLFDFNLESLLKEMIEDKNFPVDFEATVKLAKNFEKFAEMDKIQNFFSNKKAITTKYINIIDPMFQTNNLGKSVNFHNFSKIKKVFQYVHNEADLITKAKLAGSLTPYEYFNSLLNFFNKTVIGINPDLFNLYLPLPKIMIMVRERQNLLEKEEVKNCRGFEKNKKFLENEIGDSEYDNNDYPMENELDSIIKNFNNHFVINNLYENNQQEPITSYPINLMTDLYSNSPLKQKNVKSFELEEFGINSRLITKDIIDFVINNNEIDSYDFESSLDINIIEEFINNCN